MRNRQYLYGILKTACVAFLFVVLTGCSPNQLYPIDKRAAQHGLSNPDGEGFQICYRHGCELKASVSLLEADWKKVKSVFLPLAKGSAMEREQIAMAIPILEKIIGEKTGIDSDLGGSFAGLLEDNQMDCVDEALNTHTFFKLLEQERLIRFHAIAGIANRGFFFNGWPHVACAIKEVSSNDIFVIDSWFYDQGKPVHILPFDVWKSGWKPEDWHSL